MAELPRLDAVEQRILGSLLEKQRTVPASYPLTLNGLRTACNQASSREPVMDLDEATIHTACRALRDRDLVRTAWADHGRRTRKFHQLLSDQLSLDDAEAALITVLLLRGPQAPGELRTRTERLHPFADRNEVEQLLQAMAEREPALVSELSRQPGQKDARWIHLFGPIPIPTPPEHVSAPSVPEVDVLADGPQARDERVLRAYDAIAPAYAAELSGGLGHLPFERWVLERVAEEAGSYPVLDAGCGPGHVTAFLDGLGARARGIDVSPAMVEVARQAFPGVQVNVGDLRRVIRPADADGWGAVLAWYSLIHFAPRERAEAIAGLARVLRPGGLLVLALHAGHGVQHRDSWFGWTQLGLDLVLAEPVAVVVEVEAAGLTQVEWYRAGPVAQWEETSERLYVLARKPG